MKAPFIFLLKISNHWNAMMLFDWCESCHIWSCHLFELKKIMLGGTMKGHLIHLFTPVFLLSWTVSQSTWLIPDFTSLLFMWNNKTKLKKIYHPFQNSDYFYSYVFIFFTDNREFPNWSSQDPGRMKRYKNKQFKMLFLVWVLQKGWGHGV